MYIFYISEAMSFMHSHGIVNHGAAIAIFRHAVLNSRSTLASAACGVVDTIVTGGAQ